MAVQYTGIALDNGSGVRYAKYTLDFATIAAAGGATMEAIISLVTLPQGAVVLHACVKPTALFVITGGGTVTCSIGVTGTKTFYTAASADMVATPIADATYTANTKVVTKPGTHAAIALTAVLTSTTSNLDQLTAGSVDCYVLYANVTTPSA